MEDASEQRTHNEIEELRQRLEEAEDTLRAIRNGEVDALVVEAPEGEVVYTLTTADYPYRLMIDEMNQGAVSVAPDSIILYSNRNFAGILGLDGKNVSGKSFGDFVAPELREQFSKDLHEARTQGVRRDYLLKHHTGREVPVLISFARLQPQTNSISIVVTDLTAQKVLEEELRQAKTSLEE
jgi:PAS domain S-box-containing protein